MREVSLKELLFSETATRLGIDNTPTDQVLINLQTLIYEVITPIINQFGDIKITSGYRSPELCKAIGSSVTSQHCLGQAVDCEVIGVPNKELADWVVSHLCIEQRLGDMPPIAWKQGAAATVVAASGGYPGEYVKGKVINGLVAADISGATVFHAGTKLNADQEIVTDGGRVLNVTGLGAGFQEALAQAYAGIKEIEFDQMYYRRDIGYRVSNG